MNWKEITRYQASWGAWYVQVSLEDGRRLELKFEKEPDEKVIQKVVDSIPPEPEPEPVKTNADLFIEQYKAVQQSFTSLSASANESTIANDLELKKMVDFMKPILGVK